MPKTNTERSIALRKKRRALGYKLYQEWVTESEKEYLKAQLKKRRESK